MVLSNMALLYGTDPAELNEWFHLGFVDAYHWVTTPNVVAMGSFGTDVLSSKPYAASGSYVNRMSDYCATCPYAVSRTTGEGACPLNARSTETSKGERGDAPRNRSDGTDVLAPRQQSRVGTGRDPRAGGSDQRNGGGWRFINAIRLRHPCRIRSLAGGDTLDPGSACS